MTATAPGIGIRRLQHLVLYVSDVERSKRFYQEVLGFEIAHERPGRAVFLRIPGGGNDHDLGLFQQDGVTRPDTNAARMYHAAWEVGDIMDLARAAVRIANAGALEGGSNHGGSLSLYGADPDGLEFEVFWAVPGGPPADSTRPLDLIAELRARGLNWPIRPD